MSTIIQTCLESQVLKLKVSSFNKDESNTQLKMKNISSNTTEYGSTSFLQYLSNISSAPKENTDKDNVYIHTLFKSSSSSSSSSRLSEKSLQLCTENLGCETGSFMMMSESSSNILSMSSNSSRKEHEERNINEKEVKGSYSNSYSIKKVKSLSAFPPPLTTMCGEKALQITSIREGGRLITKAVEIPSQESCFVADRSDGRLRLRLFNGFGTNVDVQVSQEQENEDEDKGEENEMMMNKNDTQKEVDECQNQDDDDDDDDDDDHEDKEKCKQIMSKEVVEIDNMGKEKLRRLVRCKECNKGLSNWEPMWVATS